ncbi:MAG TPA: hypothetical protein VN380_08355 [Thermoanaerobaculia bacterium]|nr:hypothetical protein [Thermoanaerobaculia bacterium]
MTHVKRMNIFERYLSLWVALCGLGLTSRAMDIMKRRFTLLDRRNVLRQKQKSFCDIAMDICNCALAFLHSEICFQTRSMDLIQKQELLIQNSGSLSHKQIPLCVIAMDI